jgi:hypothetical protein
MRSNRAYIIIIILKYNVCIVCYTAMCIAVQGTSIKKTFTRTSDLHICIQYILYRPSTYTLSVFCNGCLRIKKKKNRTFDVKHRLTVVRDMNARINDKSPISIIIVCAT